MLYIYILEIQFRYRVLRNRSGLKTFFQNAARPQTTDSYTLWHTFGRQQSCTGHDAAQATVLACTQCCPGHEKTSKLSCESALPGPQCCTAQSAARATVLHCPLAAGDSAALPTVLPRPQCWHAHNAAKSANTRANSAATPRCPGHCAALPRVMPGPHCWTAHHAAQVTWLHCPQCCPGHSAGVHTLLHGLRKIQQTSPTRPRCPGHNAALPTVLPRPQCCPGDSAAMPTMLPGPLCGAAHNAARATKTQANSPARPRYPGHSAALPTLLPGPQRCTAHRAAWATVLACTQCCQGCSAALPSAPQPRLSASHLDMTTLHMSPDGDICTASIYIYIYILRRPPPQKNLETHLYVLGAGLHGFGAVLRRPSPHTLRIPGFLFFLAGRAREHFRGSADPPSVDPPLE